MTNNIDTAEFDHDSLAAQVKDLLSRKKRSTEGYLMLALIWSTHEGQREAMKRILDHEKRISVMEKLTAGTIAVLLAALIAVAFRPLTP